MLFVHQMESVVPLQKMKIQNFSCIRLFFKTLGSIEKKKSSVGERIS